ncbi:hypothetical protein HMPREF2826_04830 [Olsenella sp. HMSC062G07]|nr:hypothetical protein HMPREF2826_04830 [Olsenella sp. HMSC062G07]
MDSVVNFVKGSWLGKAMELIGSKGFDYVYVIAGAVPTIKTSIEPVDNEGYVTYVGTPTRDLMFGIDE